MFAVWVTSQTTHKSYCGHKSQRGCLPSDPVTIIADRTTGAAAVDVITGYECNIVIRHSENESREVNTPISFCVCPFFHAGIYPCRQTWKKNMFHREDSLGKKT